jgi:DNA primase
MRGKFDTRTADGRMEAWKTILPAIERIRDRIERAAVAKDMAGYLGVDESLVLERFRKAAANRSEPAPRSQGPSVPPMERLLLNALLKSEDAQKEILPALRENEAVKRFVTHKIFETLFALTVAQDVLTFSNLEARLADADKDLLSRLVFADQGSEDSLALEQARDCMTVLERQDKELRRSNMKSRVQAAERSGDFPEALRLSQELRDLDELLRKQRGR